LLLLEVHDSFVEFACFRHEKHLKQFK